MVWKFFRSDAVEYWESGKVQNALPHYSEILNRKRLAKYLIAKKIETNIENPSVVSTEELIRIHESMKQAFSEKIKQDPSSLNKETPTFSFLDLKIEIAKRILSSCEFCERKCQIDRTKSKGHCRIDAKAKVSSSFAHTGEETPLVPSGTIFFTGCTFDCVFCQNYDISSLWKEGSSLYIDNVDGKRLFEITNDLILENKRYPIKNINYVGGDPTPNINIILESLKYLEENIPLIWNSNFYNSEIAISLLKEIIDVWLLDFKFGNNQCAFTYCGVRNYFDLINRNFRLIYNGGSEEIIIRHLLMPGHIECCTEPILRFIKNNIPRVQVNIMEQYRPHFKVNEFRYPELNRRCSKEEIERAFDLAKQYHINIELCS